MATKKISNITFMPVVESISRKFALRKEVCTQNLPISYMGSGCRKKRVNGTSVKQNYFFMRKNPRVSQPSSSELDMREYFQSAVRWANAAYKDLNAIDHNQEAFLESNNTHKTIKGCWAGNYYMKGWLTAIAIKILKAGETLPQNHQVPAFDA